MTRRSGLGRGLDTLIPPQIATPQDAVSAAGSAGESVQAVSIDEIEANHFQPRKRFAEESLEGLAKSVAEVGVLQPIIVRPRPDGGYELIAGERRWRAARLAGLDTIPAIIRRAEDVESLEQAIVENLHREDLNAVEEAAALRQLIDEFRYTQEQVARRVGRSRSAVANSLRLLQLPIEVQGWVRDGQLSAGHGRAILSLPDEARQRAFAARIMAQGLSVRDSEEAARQQLGRDQTPDSPPARQMGEGRGSDERGRSHPGRPAGVLELERLLSERLSTRVSVEMNAKHGRIVVEFADLNDLERIYRTLIDP